VSNQEGSKWPKWGLISVMLCGNLAAERLVSGQGRVMTVNSKLHFCEMQD